MNLKPAILSLIKLSGPIIMGQIGQMLIGAGDVYIATMYSTNSVASIGVANGVFNPIFLFGIGLMMGVSPSLAFTRGKTGKKENSLSTIILYALVSGILLTFAMLGVNKFIPLMGFADSMVPSIQKYLEIVSWSIPFAIVFQGIKEYLQAYEKVMFPNLLTIFAVFLNLVINYVLVFGFASFEGYGEVGLAWASFYIRVFLCIAILIYILKDLKIFEYDFQLIKTLFRFSFPIAFMFFLEVMAFCTVTILSGQIGVIAAATNNIVLTVASIAFMVPLSLSSAVAVKIGHNFGQQDFKAIKVYIKSCLLLQVVFVLISAGCFFIFPGQIMNFITSDLQVIELGISLLFIVAIFQISDSTQVIFAGILRGMKFTKTSSLMVFVGYWILGIPYGYYLAFYQSQGAAGLWIGLAISLTFSALFLVSYTIYKFRQIEFAK